MASLADTISRLLPNGLGARGDEERSPSVYPARSLHVLLATSGSVASIKAPLIVRELLKVSNGLAGAQHQLTWAPPSSTSASMFRS